ncbi:hypothetical protein V1282_006943 [Nitrobacteraceae bacterium AZCC 2146]
MVAAGWPKRRENRISFTAGLRSISRRITTSVSSGDGSIAKMIS